jgi:hypothetical protein
LENSLFANGAGSRGAVLRYLVSDKGRKVFEETQSERVFHAALRNSADAELRILLDAIASYELFSRTCQNAFDDVLVEMTRRGGTKLTPRELSSIDAVKIASKRLPEIFNELLERLEPFREASRFADVFAPLAERTDAASWAERLLGHHVATQQKKPPIGKSPWFERFDDGGVIIRPLYRRDKPGRRDDIYLHGYRTRPLYTFARDLRLIPA